MILLEVTRKLRRVMTRSSRASDRLDLPVRLERSRQNRDRSGVKGAVFRAGESPNALFTLINQLDDQQKQEC